MNDKTLIAISKAVLTELIGRGNWCKPLERPTFMKCVNPLPGLSPGDVVYSYESEEEKMVAYRVLVVAEGVGYVFWESAHYGPSLTSVSADDYGRTQSEAVKICLTEISDDIEYNERRKGNLAYLKNLLKECDA